MHSAGHAWDGLSILPLFLFLSLSLSLFLLLSLFLFLLLFLFLFLFLFVFLFILKYRFLGYRLLTFSLLYFDFCSCMFMCLTQIIDRIVAANVHRLVVVDDEKRLKGIVSLSDILSFLVSMPSTNA